MRYLLKTGTNLRCKARASWIPALCLALLGTAAARQPGAGAIPAPVDLRPALAKWGLEPRVQGARGTCSAFVVTEAIEYAAAARSGTGTRFSVEFLNWASNKEVGANEDGGFFSDLWKGFVAHGICPEGEMPYEPKFDANLRPSAAAERDARAMLNPGLRLHWIKEWNVKTGLTGAHLAAIRSTLARNWPVCAGLRWPKREQWRDGTLAMVPPEGVRDGHSVLLVGYRDDPQEPGGGVLLFRNTAGPSRDGRMTYEYARAYMNDAAWIDADVPPAAARAPPLRPDLMGLVGTAPVGRNHRVSSNQQPGWHTENLDMTWLQPGESVEMPRLEGPGVITHMWFTSHAGWADELNALSLRIYWDGRAAPAIEAPLGDFFAVGQGKPAVVESFPVQVSPTGALTCYWRMPFRKSARIVVTNDNPDRGAGLYWQVDWTQVESIPEDTPCFHAKYRQEYPAQVGRDYLLADLTGSGLYIGTVMSVTLAQEGWFGEGDDFFYIDGEEVPSLQGTGSEDYFNDAWGFRARTSQWFGSPRWQGDSTGDSGVCYRWHIADPVSFATSLRVAIEHKGNREPDYDGFFLERPDFFSSVAFWYQRGEPKAWDPLPPWPQRRVPWVHVHLVPAFRQVNATGEAKVRVDTSGLFGARPMLLWPNKAADATLTIPFQIAAAGRYAVRLNAASGPAYGSFDAQIDGKNVGVAAPRAPEGGEADISLGVHTLAAGEHTISFRPAGPDAAGSLGVEMLRLLPLPPEAAREQRTHHEAHFIRLAIGRAVYAYRLAYGELPASLQALVDSGIMQERFLRDENSLPLLSRRDGDAIVVESKGPEAWTKSWKGLDARR